MVGIKDGLSSMVTNKVMNSRRAQVDPEISTLNDRLRFGESEKFTMDNLGKDSDNVRLFQDLENFAKQVIDSPTLKQTERPGTDADYVRCSRAEKFQVRSVPLLAASVVNSLSFSLAVPSPSSLRRHIPQGLGFFALLILP